MLNVCAGASQAAGQRLRNASRRGSGASRVAAASRSPASFALVSERPADPIDHDSAKLHAASTPTQRVHDLLFLGRGGMGEVHLCVEISADGSRRLFVRKRLRPSLADDSSVRKMFVEEARLA
ncbi:MAG: hypothetical protein ACHREM_32470, partial [Polyangiales bacterium]